MRHSAANAARILTVEDDPIVQSDLRLILEDAGYIVSNARDGLEAVEQARRHRPDLILMDIGLPRLDGIAATERILGERDVPIVALTGEGNRDGLDRVATAGAVRHVVKPFSEGELIDTLADVLAERDAADRHLKIMIESMVRAGHSEHEIIAAVEHATGRRKARSPAVRNGLGRLARRAFGGRS
jgi:CheY-like chemotaxis protein